MARAAENLTSLIEPVVDGLGYEMLGIEYIAQGRNSVLRIYIDSEQGIQLADCERVSRQVSAVLDVEEPLKGQYVLEVSSPGLDRPLFKPEHYARFVGHRLRVRLRRPQDGQRRFHGLLEDIDEQGILLRDADKGQGIKLAFAEIEQANLEPEL
jgi:ribosome maturation factor RimP